MLFNIFNKYNFVTHAPAIFGGSFRRAQVTSIMDYKTALQYSNVDIIQRQVYPLLPAGTPDRVSQYTFVRVINDNGISTVLAYPWIIESSIVRVTSLSVNVSITDIDDSDILRIRDTLNSLGYTYVITPIL